MRPVDARVWVGVMMYVHLCHCHDICVEQLCPGKHQIFAPCLCAKSKLTDLNIGGHFGDLQIGSTLQMESGPSKLLFKKMNFNQNRKKDIQRTRQKDTCFTRRFNTHLIQWNIRYFIQMSYIQSKASLAVCKKFKESGVAKESNAVTHLCRGFGKRSGPATLHLTWYIFPFFIFDMLHLVSCIFHFHFWIKVPSSPHLTPFSFLHFQPFEPTLNTSNISCFPDWGEQTTGHPPKHELVDGLDGCSKYV